MRSRNEHRFREEHSLNRRQASMLFLRFSHSLFLRFNLVMLFSCSFSTAVFGAVPPRITAFPEVTVSGDKIRLGALLKVESHDSKLQELMDSTVLTSSPAPGKSKAVSEVEIIHRLEALGIGAERFSIKLPAEILVSRRFQTLTLSEIASRITQEFLPELRWKDAHLEKVEVPESIVLPIGKVELNFNCSPSTDLAKPFFLNINIIVDGEVVKRVFLRTVLSIHQTVAVAAQELKTSQAVTSTDVRWETQRLSSTLHPPITEMAFFRGKRPRFSIVVGRVLTEDLFVSTPLIKRGANVVLLFENQNIRLTTQGKSLASGFRGQQIRVVNSDSGKELLAEVVDEKTARVVF